MSEFVYLFRSSESQQREFMGNPERAQQSMQVWLAWMRGLEEKGHLKNPGQPLGHKGKVVRGKEKARTILLWVALAHNMMRSFALRRAAAEAAA